MPDFGGTFASSHLIALFTIGRSRSGTEINSLGERRQRGALSAASSRWILMGTDVGGREHNCAGRQGGESLTSIGLLWSVVSVVRLMAYREVN